MAKKQTGTALGGRPKSTTARAQRVLVTLFPAVLRQLDVIASEDARDGAPPNRSGTIAKLITREHAKRERAKARQR